MWADKIGPGLLAITRNSVIPDTLALVADLDVYNATCFQV